MDLTALQKKTLEFTFIDTMKTKNLRFFGMCDIKRKYLDLKGIQR